MLAPDFIPFLATLTNKKVGTVADRAKALRATGMFDRGVQGPGRGAHVSTIGAINLLLASVIDPRRGDDVAANVERMRSTPLAEGHHRFPRLTQPTDTLSFIQAQNLGAMLDALVNDIRSGEFAAFEKLHPQRLQISFNMDWINEDASLSVTRVRMIEGMGSWFFNAHEPHQANVWYHVSARETVFLEIAEKLGPLPDD